MSSSKIIRSGSDHPVVLAPLGQMAPLPESDIFKAVPLAWVEPPPAVEEEVVEVAEEPPPPPGIPEEEVARMVEEAYEAGARDGKLQAQSELNSLCESLGEALVKTVQLREEVMQESEESLLTLAVAIARKVIQREISLAPEIVGGIAAAAVEYAGQGDEIVVRLNKNEYQQLLESPHYLRFFGDKQRIQVKGDAALPAASCLVETSRGDIDAGLDSQLDEIMRRLIEAKHGRHEETQL